MWSVITVNSAIVTLQNHELSTDVARKEKRGAFGFGVHGHHHYAPHYDEFPPYHPHPHHHHHAVGPPLPPAIPPHPPAPVNLGAHFHTTVTKKIGVPIPYPYPVKVRINDRVL